MDYKKVDLRIALYSLVLAVLVFTVNIGDKVITEYKDNRQSTIKLKVVEVLSEEDFKITDIISKTKEYLNFYIEISDNEINQAIYKLLTDKVIVYLYDSKLYQVSSFTHRDELNILPYLKTHILNFLSDYKLFEEIEGNINDVLINKIAIERQGDINNVLINKIAIKRLSKKIIYQALGELYLNKKILIKNNKYKAILIKCNK